MLVAAPIVAPPVVQRRSLILLTLCLGVLIAQVDTSVVNLALRPIGEGLDVGIVPLQWVVDGYNLTYALFLLTTPFEHHDFSCELKTPLHCTACTSSVVGSQSAKLAPVGAWTLTDLGAAFTPELPAHHILLAVSSGGRSPPAFV